MPHKEILYHPINQSKLYKITTKAKLAAALKLSAEEFRELLRSQPSYSKRTISLERNGKKKHRDIQEPKGKLHAVHKRVARLLSRITPPNFLYCPVKRRSYVSNAAQHLSGKVIHTFDVCNYFPSTSRKRVYWFFHSVMGCSSDVSGTLANLLTVDEHLATGSTVSPILSFYAYYDMWQNISDLALQSDCTLTVYIDDITVSGQSFPKSLLWNIRHQIHSHGLRYHKERHYGNGVGEITGVFIKNKVMKVPNRQHLKSFEVSSALLEDHTPDAAGKLNMRLKGLRDQRKQVEGGGMTR